MTAKKNSIPQKIVRILSQILAVICVGLLVTMMVNGVSEGRLSIREADQGGLLFFFAVLLYRSSPTLWWAFLVPASAAALFAPVTVLELSGTSPLGELLRASLAPTFSLMAGFLVAVVRDTRMVSTDARTELEGLSRKGRDLSIDLRNLERDVKTLLIERRSMVEAQGFILKQSTDDFVADLRASGVTLKTQDFGSSDLTLQPSEIITHRDLHSLLAGILEEMQNRQNKTRGRVRFSLTAASDESLPVAVRGSAGQVERVFRSLVAQALDSLGGGAGFVRVTLHPTLSSIRILIEDNGRGLGESRLARVIDRDASLLSVPEVRREIENLGGRFDIVARLGVGSRSTVDLARVDAFAHAERIANRLLRESRFAEINPDVSLPLS